MRTPSRRAREGCIPRTPERLWYMVSIRMWSVWAFPSNPPQRPMSSWSVRSPGVPERGVAQVVREADRLDQVRVDVEVVPQGPLAGPQELADRAPDLGHLHRVREARAVEVVLPGEEDLRLRLELAEGVRVDDPVAVYLEGVAVVGLALPAGGLAVEGSVESVGHGDSR